MWLNESLERWRKQLSLPGRFGRSAYGRGSSQRARGRSRLAGPLCLEALEERCLLAVKYSIADLGTLGGTNSSGNGINSAGQVVGYSATTDDAAVHAFLYDGTTMQDLGTLGGTISGANGINDSSQAVGYSGTTGNAKYHAFLYNGTAMQDLGTLGGTDSEADGINAGGRVVGWAYTPLDAARHAFLYNGVVMLDLNFMIPPGTGWVLSRATAISDKGQIVGFGIFNGQSHAFLLTPLDSGGMGPGGAPGGSMVPEGLPIGEGSRVTAAPLASASSSPSTGFPTAPLTAPFPFGNQVGPDWNSWAPRMVTLLPQRAETSGLPARYAQNSHGGATESARLAELDRVFAGMDGRLVLEGMDLLG